MALPTATTVPFGGGGDVGTPCEWIIGRGGAAQLQCRDQRGKVWSIRVDLTVQCPQNQVIREPYPRALVSVPNNFGLLPASWNPSENGLWSDPQEPYNLRGLIDAEGNPLEEGLVRRVQYGMRAQRLAKEQNWLGRSVPDITWSFTGNSSDGSPKVRYGITATYAYASASFVGAGVNTGAVAGKGRRFDFGARRPSNLYDLPAFPVKVSSFCGFWQSVKLEESVKYWQQLSRCFDTYTDENGDPVTPAGFSDEGCPTGQIAFGEWRYKWEPRVLQSWTPLDLRVLGLPDPYLEFSGSTSAGLFKGVLYEEPVGRGIWVPVVEAQTVNVDQ
jgi:hypothetical protein